MFAGEKIMTNNKAKVNRNTDQAIDYKNLDLLKSSVLDSGRIIPGRITNMSPRKQRAISRSVKLARYLSLLPYTDKH